MFNFLIVKKNNNKENILLWVVISLFTLMSYTSLISFVFTYIKIPINTL